MESQSVDDLIVCLMSMGFDYEDCQEAVQNGHLSVERAVEWLLAGKPRPQTSNSAPKLSLRNQEVRPQTIEDTSNPFVNPIPTDLPSTSTQASSKQQTGQTESNQSDTVLSRSKQQTGQTESNQSDTVLSRLHLSDSQKKVKENFEARRREEARNDAIKEKQRRKRDHERVLKEIAEDREKKKLTTFQQHGLEDNSPQKSDSTTCPPTQLDPGTSQAKPSPTNCRIQIRMLDGRLVKESYQASDSFQQVWLLVKKSCPDIDVQVIQPFPHREFRENDCNSSLQELGLTPSASLMVKKTEASQAVSRSSTDKCQVKSLSYGNKGAAGANLGVGGPLNALFGQDQPPPPALGQGNQIQFQHHDWGPGNRIDQEVEDDDEGHVEQPPQHNLDMEDEASDDEDELVQHGLPPAFVGGGMMGGGMGGGMMGGGMAGLPPGLGGAMGGPNDAFWGVGQRLVPEGHPQAHDAHRYIPPAQLVAEKARERYKNPVHIKDNQPEPSTSAATPSYNVSHLVQLCMNHVAQRVANYDPKHPLLSLSGISEEVAQKILFFLLKEKLLRPKVLNVFIPCYIRRIVLDCYPYATNEMLHAVRYHTQLRSLSLKSCSLITDSAIRGLSCLKKLKHLNLSCCRQLTDKCLDVVKEMPSLTSLNLEGTGITDAGIMENISAFPTCFQNLNLNKTSITERLIPHLKELTNLRTLYLEQTQIHGLTGIDQLTKLETLDVSGTDIVTESLLCLGDSITCLGMSQTQRVNGDNALEFIQRLKLHTLHLPDRHTLTDVGMRYISSMPLTELDLTNYICIGDLGMQSVGQIKTLKKLLLSNTKVTDEGMMHLKDLTALEILNLDRTLITDACAEVIKGFTSLIELSLASTNVTSQFLVKGDLSSLFYLSKLNLSRTQVSNTGMKCLKLQSLTLLNLDGTCVKSHISEILYENCPLLKRVTLSNLVQRENESDED